MARQKESQNSNGKTVWPWIFSQQVQLLGEVGVQKKNKSGVTPMKSLKKKKRETLKDL